MNAWVVTRQWIQSKGWFNRPGWFLSGWFLLSTDQWESKSRLPDDVPWQQKPRSNGNWNIKNREE